MYLVREDVYTKYQNVYTVHVCISALHRAPSTSMQSVGGTDFLNKMLKIYRKERAEFKFKVMLHFMAIIRTRSIHTFLSHTHAHTFLLRWKFISSYHFWPISETRLRKVVLQQPQTIPKIKWFPVDKLGFSYMTELCSTSCKVISIDFCNGQN